MAIANIFVMVEKKNLRWSRRPYSQEDFVSAWNSSKSKSEVLRKLNVPIGGGNLNTISRTADILGLSFDHLDRYWSFRKENPERVVLIRLPQSLDEILVSDSSYSNTFLLKQRLFKEGIKKEQCEVCGLTDWLGKPAPLALDHINGVRKDNRLENLRVLCYNCHGQTETYSGKKRL